MWHACSSNRFVPLVLIQTNEKTLFQFYWTPLSDLRPGQEKVLWVDKTYLDTLVLWLILSYRSLNDINLASHNLHYLMERKLWIIINGKVILGHYTILIIWFILGWCTWPYIGMKLTTWLQLCSGYSNYVLDICLSSSQWPKLIANFVPWWTNVTSL